MEPENGKIDNENKENKDIDEFQEYILQQKPANTEVKSQSDMKCGMPYNKSFIDQASSV